MLSNLIFHVASPRMSTITITIKENGPYRISVEDAPNVVILDNTGARIEPTPGKGIALCRCGASSKKPFCDGTHSKIGFQGAMAAAQAADGALATGPLLAP